jgi:hypothetical protein
MRFAFFFCGLTAVAGEEGNGRRLAIGSLDLGAQ